MSRAKEIKEKEQLQAKLALAFGRKRQTVLSWLGEDKSHENDIQNKDKNGFLNLPVMSAGSLLNLNNTTTNRMTSDNKKEIGTIGEFLKGDRKVSSLTRKKNYNSGVSSSLDANKNDNKATLAFKNKMRDDHRKKLRKQTEGSVTKNGTKPHAISPNNDSDSDDDMKFKAQKHQKNKNMPLQFGRKHKK